jgi:hypothetical protein
MVDESTTGATIHAQVEQFRATTLTGAGACRSSWLPVADTGVTRRRIASIHAIVRRSRHSDR